MPSLTDCLAKSPLPEAHQKYIVERSRFHQEKGLSESDADAQAIKDLQAETRASLRDVYRQLGVKGYELPKMKVASGEQPVQPKGHTPVTLSGLSEQERQQRIEQRKAKTTLSDRGRATNEVMDIVKRYNELPGGHLGKMKEEGRSLLNSIRVKASELGMTFDERAGKMRNAEGTIIRKNFSEVGDKAIKDNGKTLMERDSHTQDVFKQLLDEGIFPNGTRLDGKTMSEAEREGTIDDIVNGIPSERAHNYLDQLEGMIGKNRYEIGDNKTGKTAVPLDTLLNVSKSVTTEPMSEDALQKWLSGESELPNDDHLLHNLEHILEDYEPEQDQAGREESPATEVQQPEPNTEKGSTGAAEPNEPPTASAGSPEESADGAGPTKSAAEPVSGGAEPPKEGAGVASGSEENVTGVKKAMTEKMREEKGLGPAERTKMGSRAEVLERGRHLVDTKAVDPRQLVNRILSGDEGYKNEDEVAAMIYYAHQLREGEAEIKKELDKYNGKEGLPEYASYLQLLNDHNDEMERMIKASEVAQGKWGKIGNMLQVVVNDLFEPVRVHSYLHANYDGLVPEEVKQRVDAALKQRKEALEELKAAHEEARRQMEENAVQQMKKDAAYEEREAKRKQTREELEKERDEIFKKIAEIKEQERNKGYTTMGPSIPNAMIPYVGHLALSYFKSGVVTIEGLTDKVFTRLQHLIPNLDRDELRRVLGGYDRLHQAAQKKHIEGVERKTADAQKQAATGKFREWPEKMDVAFKKNTRVLRAEAKLARAEFVLKQEKIKAAKSRRSKLLKSLDWVNRWERRLVLLSAPVYVKLSAAALIGSALSRPIHEVTGLLFSTAFSELANKAPIEGCGINAHAIADFYTEFFNPKKFIKNSGQIIKTGSTDLAKQLDGNVHQHYSVFDVKKAIQSIRNGHIGKGGLEAADAIFGGMADFFTGDLHSIIKDPAKRAKFQYALTKLNDYYQRNRIADINDPLVQHALKIQAYKAGKYEIFQEDSAVARAFNNFVEDWRKSKDPAKATTAFLIRFAIPIQTVPMNIARRIGLSVTGLPRGLWSVAKAYHKGIESLSEEQADMIMRQLKIGSMGMALLLTGFFTQANHLGGLYQQWTSKREKDDMPFDYMNIGGFDFDRLNIDKSPVGPIKVGKALQHALPFQVSQLGATFARIYHHYDDLDESKIKSIGMAIIGSTSAIMQQIPVISTPVNAVNAISSPRDGNRAVNDLQRKVGIDKYNALFGDKNE